MDYVNLDGFIGCIISTDKATLHELETVYTLEKAFLIWEAVMVTRYNEWLAVEAAKRRK